MFIFNVLTIRCTFHVLFAICYFCDHLLQYISNSRDSKAGLKNFLVFELAVTIFNTVMLQLANRVKNGLSLAILIVSVVMFVYHQQLIVNCKKMLAL